MTATPTEALFPSWPTPCLRISLAPGCHLCCRHEVVSTADTFPFHQPSVSAAAGLQRSATVPSGARDRHFRQLKAAAISERPASPRLGSSPSARPEPVLEPVVADWREGGKTTEGRRMRDGGDAVSSGIQPRSPLRVPIGNWRGPRTENPFSARARPAPRPAGATSPPSNQRQSLSLPPILAEQQAGLRSQAWLRRLAA